MHSGRSRTPGPPTVVRIANCPLVREGAGDLPTVAPVRMRPGLDRYSAWIAADVRASVCLARR